MRPPFAAYLGAAFRSAHVLSWLPLLITLAMPLAVARAQEPAAHSDSWPSPSSLIDPAMPAWVRPIIDLASLPDRPIVAGSPLRMRLIEVQTDVETHSQFSHYAYRIESEAGLQQAGQVSVDFAPSYQSLRWHFLRVWRDGHPRETLRAADLQVLRQEESAERFLYHGRLNALILLHDLRVGDTVEFAHTRSGGNPVFAGRFSTSLAGALSTPIDRLSYRIRSAPGRPLLIAPLGGFNARHHEETHAGRIEHRWESEDIAPVRAFQDAPAHAMQFPYLQLTEYVSWEDVRAWAAPLFALPQPPPPEIAARMRALTEGIAGQREQANALLRFVQDDIRYLGLQLHESTHRPAAPERVLERRFGDCKDKSLLLVALLREIGLEADVALVNSSVTRGLRELQASPLSFDHVIVRVWLPGTGRFGVRAGASFDLDRSHAPAENKESGYVWIDPTISLQGGRIEERHLPDYGWALVLGDGPAELTEVIPARAGKSVISIRDRYTVADYSGAAEMELISTYRGASADAYRYYRKFVDTERATRELTAQIQRFIPKIKALGHLSWEDNREANVLVSRLSFELEDFWSIDAKGEYRRIELYPWALSTRLPRPEATERSAPFAQPHPAEWSQHSTVRLPKAWPSQQDSHEIEDAAFAFNYSSRIKGDVVDLSYEWRTLADAVPPQDMDRWTTKMNEARATFGYQLQQDVRLAAALEQQTGLVWPLCLALAFGALTGLALGVWLYRRRPAFPLPEVPLGDRHLAGIGGWLVLLALGITVRPFALLLSARGFLPHLNTPSAWILRTDPRSAGYASGFAGILVAEFFMAALLLAWSFVTVIQFYRRKVSTPLTLIATFVVSVTWVWADHSLNQWLIPESGEAAAISIARLIGNSIAPILWIAYLAKSRRVDATFRN